MKSKDLGLPIEYQQYPEYFDIPSNQYHTNEKNNAIEKVLRRYKCKKVLDMACGTGAQVFYLLSLGYQVIGADFSPGLLQIAREKALKQNIAADFIDGDMRNLQVGEFDAVITIDNAIGHLVKNDFNDAVTNIYKNLKSGGIYVFDILNLDAMTDDIIQADSETMSSESITNDGTIIRNVRHSTIDRNNGILTSDETINIQKNDECRQIKNKCSLQIYSMKELDELLTKHGFQVLEQRKINAYSFHPDDNGYSILTAARKTT